MKERLGILISGNGTTMEAIIAAYQQGKLPMDIACIVASTPKARGLERARNLGIPDDQRAVVNPQDFRENNNTINRDAFGKKLLDVLKTHRATIVIQCGWLPLTPIHVIDAYNGKIFNQHPGPLPDFGGPGMYGRRVHAARLLFVRKTKRDFWTEAVIHHVDPEFDKGAVIARVNVPIMPEDTVEDLQTRALPVEHTLAITTLQHIARGKIKNLPQKPSLIQGEEALLEDAKLVARLLYPRG